MVAAKIMVLQDDEEYNDVIKEVAFLKKLSEDHNPNIVNYINSYYSKTLKELWIIMEFCSKGSITDLMRDANRVLDEGECAFVIKHLLEALVYLKQKKILHRDIKGGNILITEEGDVKISDFGVSSQLNNTFSKRSTFIGTPYWMAPEIIKKSTYNYAADVWSTGITTIELLEGRPPFSNLHPMRAMMVIPQQPAPTLRGQKSPLTNKPYSEELNSFLETCLVKDPEKRPTAEQLLQHEFIKKATNLEKLMEHTYEQESKDEQERNSLDVDVVARKSVELGKQHQGIFGQKEHVEDDPEGTENVAIDEQNSDDEEFDYGTVVRAKPAAPAPETNEQEDDADEFDYGTVVRKPQAQANPEPEEQDIDEFDSGTVVRQPAKANAPQPQAPQDESSPAEKTDAKNGK